jgi:hypothetical protein
LKALPSLGIQQVLFINAILALNKHQHSHTLILLQSSCSIVGSSNSIEEEKDEFIFIFLIDSALAISHQYAGSGNVENLSD